MLHRLGKVYASVLADQRQILRSIFSQWSGQEVDTQYVGYVHAAVKAGYNELMMQANKFRDPD